MLRSLIEEGGCFSPRAAASSPWLAAAAAHAALADGFRVIVLANRPGYSSRERLFREMGDILATHVVDNPALPSEVVPRGVRPDVPPPPSADRGDLRRAWTMADAGEIAYLLDA